MDSIWISSMLFGVERGVGYPRTGYPKERSIYGRIWNGSRPNGSLLIGLGVEIEAGGHLQGWLDLGSGFAQVGIWPLDPVIRVRFGTQQTKRELIAQLVPISRAHRASRSCYSSSRCDKRFLPSGKWASRPCYSSSRHDV